MSFVVLPELFIHNVAIVHPPELKPTALRRLPRQIVRQVTKRKMGKPLNQGTAASWYSDRITMSKQ